MTESKPAAATTSAVHGLGMVSQALVAQCPAAQMDLSLFCIIVWSKVTLPVEMDEMRLCVGHPHFCSPGDFTGIFRHIAAVQKGSNVYQARSGISEQMGQLVSALGVHGAVTGDCLDKKEPILVRVVYHHIGHFAVIIDADAQSLESIRVEVSPFLRRYHQRR